MREHMQNTPGFEKAGQNSRLAGGISGPVITSTSLPAKRLMSACNQGYFGLFCGVGRKY